MVINAKYLGALVGALVVLLILWLGWGATALIILGGIVGYLVGMYIEGELDLSSLQRRRQY